MYIYWSILVLNWDHQISIFLYIPSTCDKESCILLCNIRNTKNFIKFFPFLFLFPVSHTEKFIFWYLFNFILSYYLCMLWIFYIPILFHVPLFLYNYIVQRRMPVFQNCMIYYDLLNLSWLRSLLLMVHILDIMIAWQMLRCYVHIW